MNTSLTLDGAGAADSLFWRHGGGWKSKDWSSGRTVAGEYGCPDHIQNGFGFPSLQSKTRRRRLGGEVDESRIMFSVRLRIHFA
jgi:hypothetical protein